MSLLRRNYAALAAVAAGLGLGGTAGTAAAQGCASGNCGAGGGCGAAGCQKYGYAEGPIGKGNCTICGQRIFPASEKHYIKQFCGPTAVAGSCFGHFKTQWTPWGAACQNWAGGDVGTDPSGTWGPPPRGSVVPNQTNFVEPQPGAVPFQPGAAPPAGGPAAPPSNPLPDPRPAPPKDPKGPSGQGGATGIPSVPAVPDLPGSPTTRARF